MGRQAHYFMDYVYPFFVLWLTDKENAGGVSMFDQG